MTAKRKSMVWKALAGLACVSVGVAGAGAQGTRRPRRESTANRKARIDRTIAETYAHRWEIAGGGGYQRFRTGQYQKQTNEVTFWLGANYALNPRLGAQAEVRGAYGNARLGNNAFNLPDPQVSNYAFLAGPSCRFVSREKFAVTGVAEGGVGLGKFDGGSKGLPASAIGVWTGTYAAAFSATLNLDYNLSPALAVRVAPTYLGTTFGGTLQNSKGINVGFVYRFGHIR